MDFCYNEANRFTNDMVVEEAAKQLVLETIFIIENNSLLFSGTKEIYNNYCKLSKLNAYIKVSFNFIRKY